MNCTIATDSMVGVFNRGFKLCEAVNDAVVNAFTKASRFPACHPIIFHSCLEFHPASYICVSYTYIHTHTFWGTYRY